MSNKIRLCLVRIFFSSVLLPDGSSLLSEAPAKIKIFEPQTNNNGKISFAQLAPTGHSSFGIAVFSYLILVF